MFKINKNILVISGVVIVLIFISVLNFIFKGDILVNLNNQNNNTENFQNFSNENTVGERDSSGNVSNKNTTIKKTISYSGRPINEVKFGTGFSAPQGVIDQKIKDLNDLKTKLDKDLFNINDWTMVGIVKKFFNDYIGARDAWEYITVLYPDDPLAFENLGNLYAFYLHDNLKAEYNYKKAIENNFIEPSYYIALSDFYKNVLKDNAKAISILLSGSEKINDLNLLLSTASLYRDIGDKSNAIKYYEEILKISPNHYQIQEEIDKLK